MRGFAGEGEPDEVEPAVLKLIVDGAAEKEIGGTPFVVLGRAGDELGGELGLVHGGSVTEEGEDELGEKEEGGFIRIIGQEARVEFGECGGEQDEERGILQSPGVVQQGDGEIVGGVMVVPTTRADVEAGADGVGKDTGPAIAHRVGDGLSADICAEADGFADLEGSRDGRDAGAEDGVERLDVVAIAGIAGAEIGDVLWSQPPGGVGEEIVAGGGGHGGKL